MQTVIFIKTDKPLPHHRHALEHAAQENADFDNISVYVAKDCTSKYGQKEFPNPKNYKISAVTH